MEQNWLFLATNPHVAHMVDSWYVSIWGQQINGFHQILRDVYSHWSSGCDIITTHMHITIKDAINLLPNSFYKVG